MPSAALILAGGQATRFGGADKAFVKLGGMPFLDHVLRRLRGQVDEIALSANGEGTRFASYGLTVLADGPAFKGCGPLAGVAAGLRWAATREVEFLLTTPVDTPFLPSDLLARLQPGPAFAVQNERAQPLCALWPVAFLPVLEAFLHEPGRHKVREALARCAARAVVFSGPSEAFANLNSPEDLALYESLL